MDTSWCLCSWATHRLILIVYSSCTINHSIPPRVHLPFEDSPLVSFIIIIIIKDKKKIRVSLCNVVQHDFYTPCQPSKLDISKVYASQKGVCAGYIYPSPSYSNASDYRCIKKFIERIEPCAICMMIL